MRPPIQPWALFLISSVALLSRSPALAQTKNAATNTLQDPAAVATIQAALTALGGATNMALIQNSVVQGTSVDTPGNGSGPTNFTWTYQGSDFRDENDAGPNTNILVSNSGSPEDYQGSAWVNVQPFVGRANLPFHIPGLVLYNELNNPNYTLTFVGLTTVNGTAAVEVDTADNSDTIGPLVTPQQWYFDATTTLPLRVQFRIPDPTNALAFQAGTTDFANYQAVSGVLVPYQLTMKEGPLSFTATVTSAAFNVPIDPSIFTPSGGAQ